MPLRFRNIDASPDDPVSDWGFEGMLAAIDRGYPRDWRKLVSAVMNDAALRDVFDEAVDAAESEATVKLLHAMIARRERSADEEALRRLQSAFLGTGMTQTELAQRLGTSRTRLSSYLSGKVTPSMTVLVEVERIAGERRAASFAPRLVLT